ncbi:hypothetical protein Y032_0413g1017 [Ancylostoma ceylanicum]|uniref:Uncharacterized protein n=1 Tax=Ancylostoma ceylanicum TaxID=53326 RepID=A0A016X250_9BILA|nr:hypothetical protein Y032_0413g1017 [Ancylostoma ceylanicum]
MGKATHYEKSDEQLIYRLVKSCRRQAEDVEKFSEINDQHGKFLMDYRKVLAVWEQDRRCRSDEQPANYLRLGDTSSDFFPYVISGDVEHQDLETVVTSYRKPGFATLYDTIVGSFYVYLYPPHFCEAVYLCFTETPVRTEKGVKGLNLEAACESSLRFLPLEQIVYKFENGVGTPFVYVLPIVKFIANGDETEQNFIFQASLFTDRCS